MRIFYFIYSWSILKIGSMCEPYLCPLKPWYTLPQTAPGFWILTVVTMVAVMQEKKNRFSPYREFTVWQSYKLACFCIQVGWVKALCLGLCLWTDLSWRTPPSNHCVYFFHCNTLSHSRICGSNVYLATCSFLGWLAYPLWLSIRIPAPGEQTSGPAPVFLPPASRTVCLLPSGYSEKKQQATFLSGGTREGFMREEIFKERERHGEKSQKRMIKQSQHLYRPPPKPSLRPHWSPLGIPCVVNPGE